MAFTARVESEIRQMDRVLGRRPTGVRHNLLGLGQISVLKMYARRPRPPPKKLLYWRNPTDPKIRPDPTFFFKTKQKKQKQKKRQKNDRRPILKKAKPVIFLFKHLILALKMLIWGFETWLVA